MSLVVHSAKLMSVARLVKTSFLYGFRPQTRAMGPIKGEELVE